MPHVNYLIWDFDGTLASREGRWSGALLDALDEAMPHHGMARHAIQSHLRTGFPWHMPETTHLHLSTPELWWEAITPVFVNAYCNLGIPHMQAQHLSSRVRHHYYNPERWALYDDTLSALDHFSSMGWKHVILSNHGPALETLVRHFRLQERVVKVFNSAETGYEKPNPYAFQLVLDEITPYEKVWMIGDNLEADIQGAANKGIPGILVRNAHEDAVRYCENLLQIGRYIEENVYTPHHNKVLSSSAPAKGCRPPTPDRTTE